MERKIAAKMVSEFTFTDCEISHLDTESKQWNYMESKAREELRNIGLPFMGGNVSVQFRNITVMTIVI